MRVSPTEQAVIVFGGTMVVVTLALTGGVQLATLIATRHLVEDPSVLLTAYGMLGNFPNPAAAFAKGSGVPGPWLVWPCVVLVGGGLIWLWALAIKWFFSSKKPGMKKGMATSKELVAAAGTRATIKKGKTTRPTVDVRDAKDAGYFVAYSGSRRLWVSVEDSIYVWGPPRSGKTQRLLASFVLDAPGAAVVTSTRPDLLSVTSRARSRGGSPVLVFDPNGQIEVRDAFRWNLAHGCADPQVAIRRAKALSASGGFDQGVSDGNFWQGQTEHVLRSLLHAADLMDVDVDTLAQWAMSPSQATLAAEFLENSSEAAPGWAHALRKVIESHERLRDSVWMGVGQALGALSNPVTRHALSADRADQFNAEDFLLARGTLYILSTAQYAKQISGVLSALVEDLAAAARKLAAISPGQRMDPPLLLALDEADKVLPGLPSLPALVADGGGSGITTVLSLQSLAQARTAWGKDEAQALWDASNVKVILGGSTAADELKDISNLIGERDDVAVQFNHQKSLWDSSVNEHVRRIPIAPVDELRQMKPGQGLLLLRSTPAGLVQLPGWWDRSDAKELESDRQLVERVIHNAAELARTPVEAE